jgi:hypothetical protein
VWCSIFKDRGCCYTRQRLARHLSWLVSAILVSTLCRPGQSQGLRAVEVSDEDTHDLITSYRSSDPDKSVFLLRQGMPPPATDEKFRASIHQHLPEEIRKLSIDDQEIINAVREILDPVLSLYGRSRVYDIIVVNSPTPIMMSDSGVVLVVSTGMIEEATSDDELLGYAAHEVGHEYFVYYSVESRQLLQTILQRGNEPALRRKLTEILSLIELQCDAFAARTLAALKRNPLEFIAGLERTTRDYPGYGVGNHPTDSVRRKIITGIVPAAALQVAPEKSPALQNLKQMLAARFKKRGG